ncbi:BTAD domain-containing putative transcriptional regulator [Paractinoplanes atraurantiacus]|uniref:Transcriptional regulatory protein, C terminal n=1 Tax=Paractinoplanes atraurantiacus TaxID=1036182 RepID=A0A285JLG8_9ACTN|nr:BTAD domain-containing putative transcriptional regulator [Actinoplanes atraurantiacus]SNY60186.1 Transcriptional regulatory protein, C terminal [Actinoplanes atraurantiacus]
MQVRLLGPVEVEVDGTPGPVRGRRRQALLCMLALHRGRVVSADRLVDVVWHDAPGEVSGNTLQSHVSQLRHLLGGRDAIVARSPGYLLDLPRGAVDAEVAEDLVERALRSADVTERARRTRQALDLWRGPPLDGVAGLPGLDDHADRLATLRLRAVYASFEARLALGRHAEVLSELERHARDHPLDERLHGQLILALYRAERQADALAAYRRLSRSLDEELGIRPSPSLRDLEAAVRRQDPRLAAPAPPVARARTRVGTALVGRDAEKAVVCAAVEAAAGGAGGAVFVVGEPGVGKSRLADEAARQAGESDLTVLRGRSAAPRMQFRALTEALLSVLRRTGLPDDPALLPYRPALARLLPEWRADGAGEAGDSLVVLAEAVLRLAVSLSRPRGCVLILEDLHDADPETLAVVDYLVDNAAREPVLVVGTARGDPGPALSMVAAARHRRAARVLELCRLPAGAVAELAGACLDAPAEAVPEPVIEQLLASADGIPLHVEELLATMVGEGVLTRRDGRWEVDGPVCPPVPPSLRSTLTGRVDRLGPDARTVLAAASLLGRRFPAAAAGAAAALETTALLDGLREAVGAQLLVPQAEADWYAFRHALIADALQARMLPMERAVLARRAAGWLSGAAPFDGVEQLTAELWMTAGEPVRAAAQWAEAGRRAAARGAVSTAAELLERALSEPGADPDGTVAAELVRVYALAGRVDDAEKLAAGMDRGAAPVHLHLAQVAAAAGHWQQGLRELAEARRLLGDDPEPRARARMDALAAELVFGDPAVAGRRDTARRLAGRALRAAEATGQPDVACSALETLGRCARLDDLEKADALYERGLATAEANGLVTWRMNLLYHLGADHGIRAADPGRLVEALEVANRAGAVVTALNIELELAIVRLCRGEYKEAEEATARGERTATGLRLDHTALVALGERVMVAAHRGDGAQVEALHARYRRLGGDKDDFGSAVRGLGLAFDHLLHERVPDALAELRAAAAEEARRPTSYLSLIHGPHLFLSVLAGGGTEADGAAMARSAQGRARWNQQFLALSEALLHGRAGRRDEAGAAITRFLALAEPYPLARHLGLRLIAPEAAGGAWGDPASWLRMAAAHFHGTAPVVARACRAALRRSGASVPQHRRGSDALPGPVRERGITVREYEVLRLLVDRLDNREISRRLFLSPRTVEKHVAHVIAKLGAADRAGAAAFLEYG